MRVYSYLRFSSPEQKKGLSKKRQSKLAENWCARNGYELDERYTYRDEGRSGFTGANVRGKGALAKFLTLVDAGLIETPSILIVENLDRLGRQNINNALDVVKRIIMAGIDLVTLLPTEERWTKKSLETDPTAWMKLVWVIDRAHGESKMKSERAKDNWVEKRALLQTGKIVTASTPWWIDIRHKEDGRIPTQKDFYQGALVGEWEYVLNPDKCKLVKEVFRLASEGYGVSRIEGIAHEQGWIFWRKIPTQCELWRLLRNREVLGEYQSCVRNEKNQRIPTDDPPIENYFPAVVDAALFNRVQTEIVNRRKRQNGRVGDNVTNLFTGLLFDGWCEDDVPMYLHGNRGGPCLVNKLGLKRRKNKNNTYSVSRFDYGVIEKAILTACRELSPALLVPKTPAADEVARIEGELAEIKRKLERANKRMDEAVSADDEEIAFRNQAKVLASKKTLEKALTAAKSKVSTSASDQLAYMQTIIDQLEKAKDKKKFRTTLRAIISQVITRIDMCIQLNGKSLRSKKRCWLWVTFAEGFVRKILVQDGVIVTCLDSSRTIKAWGGDR